MPASSFGASEPASSAVDRAVHSLYEGVKSNLRFPCCALNCGWGTRYVLGLVEKFGAHEDDEVFRDMEFPLLEGHRASDDEKVEIEDTKTREMQAQALKHLQTLLSEILLSGAMLWGIVVGFGVLVFAFPECARSSPFVLAATGALLLWRISIMTNLMSKTLFEDRPFVRFMVNLSGFDNYHVLIALALLDLSGKFTRAIFVARALYMSASFNLRFLNEVEQSGCAFLTPVFRPLGLGGVAALAYVAGPVLIQGGFMLRSLIVVHSSISSARAIHEEEEEEDSDSVEHMRIADCLDDFGALADWAMLGPVAKVFSLAAIPLVLEDDTDAYRIWDQMQTETFRILVHILPDTIVSLYLQVALLKLDFPRSDTLVNAEASLSIFVSWASAMNIAQNLFRQGHFLTVTSAAIIIFLGIFPALGLVNIVIGGA